MNAWLRRRRLSPTWGIRESDIIFFGCWPLSFLSGKTMLRLDSRHFKHKQHTHHFLDNLTCFVEIVYFLKNIFISIQELTHLILPRDPRSLMGGSSPLFVAREYRIRALDTRIILRNNLCLQIRDPRSWIPDPTYFHPGYCGQGWQDPGSGSGSASNLSIFNPKNWYEVLKIKIRHVHAGSRILNLDFFPSRIPDLGVKKAPDPGSGSATLVVIKCKNEIKY